MISERLMLTAIERWGRDLQLNLAQEECAELIAAIAHFKRDRPNATDELIQEIADVKIMIWQLEEMFGRDAVDRVVALKMKRLESRLELGAGAVNGVER